MPGVHPYYAKTEKFGNSAGPVENSGANSAVLFSHDVFLIESSGSYSMTLFQNKTTDISFWNRLLIMASFWHLDRSLKTHANLPPDSSKRTEKQTRTTATKTTTMTTKDYYPVADAAAYSSSWEDEEQEKEDKTRQVQVPGKAAASLWDIDIRPVPTLFYLFP
ncbi:unnamed protein product [Pleuronectes platessa]|uniref:Uncharacterized protein n=1 Tax=Pleuronectes platessa TaxID=8262 RepID=A0A9N7UCV7_PLEPL|nr:unnamed protein product [Pleuronectes platessa]